MLFSIARFTILVLGFSLLAACQLPLDVDDTAATPTNSDLAEVEFERLPDAIATRVKETLKAQVGNASPHIGRYSRETWMDGCLGLGGPAESCLAALMEGWQVEAIDTNTNKSYFYRTTLNGDSIRRSTLSQNLPPSLRDRIFQTATNHGAGSTDNLSVVAAEPRLWDGCYGLPPKDGGCREIAIFGWRAIISDGKQSWVYHTDNLGTEIRLNETGDGQETSTPVR